MSPQHIAGIVLLVLGVVLLVMGLNSTNSVADTVSETFTGRFTERTTWYILGGIALGVIGLVLAAVGVREIALEIKVLHSRYH